MSAPVEVGSTSPEYRERPPNPRGTLILVFVIVFGAYVAMILAGKDGDAVVRTGILLAGVLGLGVYARGEFQNQNMTLGRVVHQTNGKLQDTVNAAVDAAVDRALAERLPAAIEQAVRNVTHT